MLATGAKLGPYEIVAPVGAGGMGEVYRAKDTRLGRDVAIKVVSPHLTEDAAARMRFEREARAISSLNHPNICSLYDVGHQDGIDFLVMEFLEGETLADRLTRGPLPLEQVLKYGAEICDGLEKAHANGVVHRDLKPANIMLTKTGAKLTDFGLAKAGPQAAEAGALTAPATLTKGLTAEGSLLGTLQYMSPEQLEGKQADTRSDIFAFGAVLYEMATGKRAFEGKSQASVIAAVLEKEPEPIAMLQPLVPPALDYVVAACLAKDPEARLQTAHDVKLQLRWITQAGAGSAVAGIPQPRPRHRWPRLLWPVAMALAVVATVALTLVYVARTRTVPSGAVTRFTIPLDKGLVLAVDATEAQAVSPDGRILAYVAAESGVTHMYLRQLGVFGSTEVPDSEGATFPFFSPDGQWVVFFSQGKLKKAPTGGGNPVDICQLPSFLGGTWLADNRLLLTVPGAGFELVPAAGGSPQGFDVSWSKAKGPARPVALPGGRWVVYSNYSDREPDILAVDLRTGKAHEVVSNALDVSYSEGRLLYSANGTIWEAPFDLTDALITGPAEPLVAGALLVQNSVAQFASSFTGVLAYVQGTEQHQGRSVYWVDRRGATRTIDLPAEDYVDPSVSPDGKHFAIATRTVVKQLLAVYDDERGVLMRLESNLKDPASPSWTPDGRDLVFDAFGSQNEHGIYRIAADGSAPPELLRQLPSTGHATSISPQGEAILMLYDPAATTALWLLSLNGAHDLQPFRRSQAPLRQGSFSPDGQWVSYASNESGRSEVYVEPVAGPGRRWQISSGGGEQPRWSHKGREIFYRLGTRMFSVPVVTSPGFAAGKPVELFDLPMDRGGAVAGYDVAPDGQRFLMVKSNLSNPTEIRMVVAWPQILQERKSAQ